MENIKTSGKNQLLKRQQVDRAKANTANNDHNMLSRFIH